MRKEKLLSKKAVVIFAGITAALIAAAVFYNTTRTHREPNTSSVVQQEFSRPISADTFQVNPTQWKSLQIASVKSLAFRTALTTDGNIATNDNQTVNIFSPYSGRVVRVVAKLGDTVKKGDALATVEASEFVQGQSDLVAAVAIANTATTQLELAKKTERRQHELLLAEAGAEKDWMQSVSDLTAAQNSVRSAETAVGAARNRLHILGQTDADLVALETPANVQNVRAESAVRSPIGGTLVQRQVGVGQYIQSAASGASTPLFVISDLASVWLIANVRESDVAAVKVGQMVEVTVPAYEGRVFKAKITWVSPLVDAITRRVPVRAEIDNRDLALKPLMLANFSILTGASTDEVGIPQASVVYEGSTAHVFIAKDDRTIQSRVVKLGQHNGEYVEVRSGITAGEKIVTGGALFIDRAVRGSNE